MIEFIEGSHTYLLDGVIIPSVTQILQKKFPDKYKGVDSAILSKKASYGTLLHKCIELIEKKKIKRPIAYCKRYLNIDIYQEESIKQYLEIKKKYNIEVLESEKTVHYKNKYCGTLDMKGLVNGKKAIIDIKTTYELDKEYVSWQDSMYELADEPQDKLYVLWLPKGHLGDLYEVSRIPKNQIIDLIDKES